MSMKQQKHGGIVGALLISVVGALLFPLRHLHLHPNRHHPLATRHEPLRRRILRFHPRDLHFPPQQLHSAARQGPRPLYSIPRQPFSLLRRRHDFRPSAVLSLPWPEPGSGSVPQLTAPDAPPLSAKIGVSVEDLAALPSLDVAAERKIERLALKVGENLFNFMQSFCGVDGSKLVVPMDILDRWFKKFQERAKRDPEYLKGFAL
ncbi:UNVERIFIED_CONTAM: hypothetical protein Slati_0204000 [Sesamum latifolium]|uniref:Hikeshi-like C-terminal domain-containing protein n=1 Tax=Sesamum latifolium TaxID=2727402 RepID=A0AAW2YBN8_9LAMI